MAKNTYVVQMNKNYESDNSQQWHTEVQSDKNLAEMWGNIQIGKSTDDQAIAFWDEIDLVCPNYDPQLDEIQYVWS